MRSAVALYRLLDVLPVFAGDGRISPSFTLVPGSEFSADALAAVDGSGARIVPWEQALTTSYSLVLVASPKGDLRLLHGHRVLLPHGAGFSKTIRGEGSPGSASGLDPKYLLPGGATGAAEEEEEGGWATVHALAHPHQVDRLRAASPRDGEQARVVGDPTLERLLASHSLRDRYRAALGTGARQLVAIASTWGPESLLRRRPGLPAELAAVLPHDTHQLALVVHPNERARIGDFELREHLAPALDAGMALVGAHEQWAATLIAADALITDHGSAALYYAAVADRPVLGACDGGDELIAGTPMARLLGSVPRLGPAGEIHRQLTAYRPGAGRDAARAAFAEQGHALDRMKELLYRLLGLPAPSAPVEPRTLPAAAPTTRTPAAFDVFVDRDGDRVRVDRVPAHAGPPGHHLAVEHGAAGERSVRSAGLLYRRALAAGPGPLDTAWTAGGWSAHALGRYPGCRAAAAVLPCGTGVLRVRGDDRLFAVRIEPVAEDGRVVRADPAAALSAVHSWVAKREDPPASFHCLLGHRAFRVLVSPATEAEQDRTF
ncbi:translation initiation factor 2 [Kitasatospora albolonga]|uniref:Translation initiation factor 2 n=1 Tax=Kitasatospora albolonga TaxID=68173 RepID=A0ABC8BLA5_9ACTN|nr:translation initiation factor 2 [Kitasatospora albolonga]